MNDEEKVRVASYGAGSITLTGLSPESIELVQGAVLGANYISFKDKKLISVPAWKELPSPTEDKEMIPFWRTATVEEKSELKVSEINFEPLSEHSGPAVTISNLGGPNESPEKYQQYAKMLESYGFDCLRSRRGLDAKYWELWYLPCLSSAKGDLEDSFRGKMLTKNTEKIKHVKNFLSKKIVFGTLNISVEKMAYFKTIPCFQIHRSVSRCYLQKYLLQFLAAQFFGLIVEPLFVLERYYIYLHLNF